MRVGQNPQKKVQGVAKPERITVAVLNYIPFVGGFYAQMPEVLKVCLNSLRDNTEVPFDLLVFDNGSCEEVVQYLVDERNRGTIQYLMLSEKNLGKGGAWNVMLDGAPGEIIAYGDNDIYYRKGWLKDSLDLLETFPRTGMVTARPIRIDLHLSATLAWAQQTPEATLDEGAFLSWETFKYYNESLGKFDQLEEQYQQRHDWRITYQGREALVGASHWQFLAYKQVVKQFLPFDMDRPMGQVIDFDRRIDEEGYLRLMTMQPYAVNLSNTLDNTPEVPELSREGSNVVPAGKQNWWQKILQVGLIKRVMLKLYDKLFDWYFRSNVGD